MNERSYKALRARLRVFVEKADERIKECKDDHERAMVGNILVFNSKIENEESKPMPDLIAVQRYLWDAIETMENLEVYASVNQKR